MIIHTTYHALERMETRFPGKDEKYMIETFKYIVKLIKKNKIIPQRSKTDTADNTYIVRYKDHKYVYKKNGGEFILITVGRREHQLPA